MPVVDFDHSTTENPDVKNAKARRLKEKTRQETFVEKGMTDRQQIVLAGAGDQQVFSVSFTMYSYLRYSQPGIPAGDVIFVLKASPHESFERSGNDLLTNITITLSEALLGFSRIIPTHIDGRVNPKISEFFEARACLFTDGQTRKAMSMSYSTLRCLTKVGRNRWM